MVISVTLDYLIGNTNSYTILSKFQNYKERLGASSTDMTIITHQKKRETVGSRFASSLTPCYTIKKNCRESPVQFERGFTHRYISYQDFLKTHYSNKKTGDSRLTIHVLVDSRYIDYQNYYQKKLIDNHQYDLNGASPLHWLLRLPQDLLLKQKTQRRSNRDSRPFRLRVT